MAGEIIRIERAKNGFTINMRDPKIDKKNRARKDDEEPYQSPFVSFVFGTVDEVVAFLRENIDKVMPLDEFETSFKEAVKGDR